MSILFGPKNNDEKIRSRLSEEKCKKYTDTTKNRKRRERFCDLTRVLVYLSSVSRAMRAPENSRTRVRVCVCVLRESFKL